MTPRVMATEKAAELIAQLQKDHGPLMFHQSGGCCDGSAPMCYPKGELMLDQSDIFLGRICDTYFYMSQDQYEYWKHTQLTVDVTEGRGSSFSLEIPYGKRFIIKSRLFSDEEIAALPPVSRGLQE